MFCSCPWICFLRSRLFKQLPESWRSLISPPVAGVVPFRYPNTACELLTCDVPQINDRLGGDETLLNLLYDFLDHEPPLNPLLASFFSKTIGNLIARKTEQVKSLPSPCGSGWLAWWMPTQLTVSRLWEQCSWLCRGTQWSGIGLQICEM